MMARRSTRSTKLESASISLPGSASHGGVVQWNLFGYVVYDDRGNFRFSGGSLDFHRMWSWINGIESGFKIGRHR